MAIRGVIIKVEEMVRLGEKEAIEECSRSCKMVKSVETMKCKGNHENALLERLLGQQIQ